MTLRAKVRAAALAAVLLFVAAAAAKDDAARMMAELMSGRSDIGTDFTLRDPHGVGRTLGDYRGKVVLVYFGYTFCPDVCPTDLMQISRALRELGPLEKEVAPLFITLDPQRDTARVLGLYVQSFHPAIVALRGSDRETQRVARAFRVYYAKRKPRGSKEYVIDHAAYTFILDREGRYRSFIPPGTPSGRTAEMLREAIEVR